MIKKAFFCPCKTHFITPSPCTPVKNVFLLLLLVKISIWNIDCRYIDTFEKYRYRYRYRYGEVENIDIDIDIDRAILKNIDIDIDKVIPKISISIWWFWKILISISIRQFCRISISMKYRIDSNLAYRTGLLLQYLIHDHCIAGNGHWTYPGYPKVSIIFYFSRFDLRFIIMADRWDRETFSERSVEDLKER